MFMEQVIDSDEVVDSEPVVDVFDDSSPSDSYGNSNDDLSIFEIDGDYDPEETDGKVH